MQFIYSLPTKRHFFKVNIQNVCLKYDVLRLFYESRYLITCMDDHMNYIVFTLKRRQGINVIAKMVYTFMNRLNAIYRFLLIYSNTYIHACSFIIINTKTAPFCSSQSVINVEIKFTVNNQYAYKRVRNYENAHLHALNEELSQIDWNNTVFNSDNIDEIYSNFISSLSNCIDNHIKKTPSPSDLEI